MISIKEKYEARKKHFEDTIKQRKAAVSRISNLRLLTFIIGIGITIYTYMMKSYYTSGILFIASSAIFVYLVILHQQMLREKRYSEVLFQINSDSVKRVSGDWKGFEDDGKDFKDENHSYSGDLDVFGKGSVFQWMNLCSTYDGRKKLAYTLTHPLQDIESINRRQEAVKELSNKLEWRQEFSAEGRMISEKSTNPDKLIKWAVSRHELYSKTWLITLCRLIPLITILLIVASFVTPLVSYRLGLGLITLQIVMLIPRNVERVLALNTIYLFKENILIYSRLLSSIENQEFNSTYLKDIKNNLLNKNAGKATDGIVELQRIGDRISDRRNLFYIIINILFLWDYQCMFDMEKWKANYGKNLGQWLETIGELEALNSLAGIAYDNTTWVMPEVKKDEAILKAKSIAHPLIGENRVSNNVFIEKPTSILLITGSNMSGKSTFLRTIGLNLILSYIGAPVCAEYFSCSIMSIYTCMRIGDNLEKSISSFYAEIIRIKMIVQAANEGEKVFFLLDEIFKGTNSIDRHMGAKLLIKQLGENNASGLVSTHDLELGEMEREYHKIKNYHFQEYYDNGELKFDYKLRSGVSTTRNAMYIIKMAGIDTDKC